MFKFRLARNVAVLALTAAPLGAATSVAWSALAAAPAANATPVACVGISTSDSPEVVVGANCPNPGTAVIDVCVAGTESSPGTNGVYVNPSEGGVGVYEPPVSVWGNLLAGPDGQALVDGTGIAAQQTPC